MITFGKNHSNFVSPDLKLHNLYCHNPRLGNHGDFQAIMNRMKCLPMSQFPSTWCMYVHVSARLTYTYSVSAQCSKIGVGNDQSSYIYIHLIFGNLYFEILSLVNLIFSLRTYFKLEFYRVQQAEKSSSSNSIFQTRELQKSIADRQED